MKQSTQELLTLYQSSLFAAAFNVCKNAQDAEDVVQDTFIQYYISNKEFDSEQHIRAWLIRVAINKAKNTALLSTCFITRIMQSVKLQIF